jgi:hypothetical protein
MIPNGSRVMTPKGAGKVKSSTGGYHGIYYTVDLDNGGIEVFIDKEVTLA